MSGWSIRSTPIWAPRRLPLEAVALQTASKMSMKVTGPDAWAEMPAIHDDRGRIVEKS